MVGPVKVVAGGETLERQVRSDATLLEVEGDRPPSGPSRPDPGLVVGGGPVGHGNSRFRIHIKPDTLKSTRRELPGNMRFTSVNGYNRG